MELHINLLKTILHIRVPISTLKKGCDFKERVCEYINLLYIYDHSCPHKLFPLLRFAVWTSVFGSVTILTSC